VAPLHQKVAKANPWRLQPKMAASSAVSGNRTINPRRDWGIPASHLLSTGDSQVHHFWHHPLVWFACHCCWCWGKHQTGNAILDACVVMCFKPWYLRPWPILEFFGSFYHPSYKSGAVSVETSIFSSLSGMASALLSETSSSVKLKTETTVVMLGSFSSAANLVFPLLLKLVWWVQGTSHVNRTLNACKLGSLTLLYRESKANLLPSPFFVVPYGQNGIGSQSVDVLWSLTCQQRNCGITSVVAPLTNCRSWQNPSLLNVRNLSWRECMTHFPCLVRYIPLFMLHKVCLYFLVTLVLVRSVSVLSTQALVCGCGCCLLHFWLWLKQAIKRMPFYVLKKN